MDVLRISRWSSLPARKAISLCVCVSEVWNFIEADSLHKIGCLLYLVYLDDDGLIL